MAKHACAANRFVVGSDLGSVRDTESGKTLALKGYGALKGKYSVKKGINLVEPILAQVSKNKPKSTSRTRTLLHAKRSPRLKKY